MVSRQKPRKTPKRYAWIPKYVSASKYPQMNMRTFLERRMLEEILSSIPGDFRKVADIGCGFGRLTPSLLDIAPEVYGFEREMGLYKAAQKMLPDCQIVNVATLTRLPVDDGLFDFAMTFTVLQHIATAEVEMILDEIKRVTSSSAYVLIVEDTDGDHRYIDRAAPTHFTLGRTVYWYQAHLEPFELVRSVPRQVEPGYSYKGTPRATVGDFMLFRREADA